MIDTTTLLQNNSLKDSDQLINARQTPIDVWMWKRPQWKLDIRVYNAFDYNFYQEENRNWNTGYMA